MKTSKLFTLAVLLSLSACNAPADQGVNWETDAERASLKARAEETLL